MQSSGVNNSLRDIFTIDENHAWAVGDSGVMVRTADGGETWQHQFADFDLSCVWFLDTNTGIAAGESEYLLRTTDGGAGWIQIFPGLSVTYEDICFIDPQNGWITGNPGQAILKTSDAGLTWEDLSIGNNEEWLMSIVFTDHFHGWLLGRNYCEDIDDAEYFFVSKTVDGGASWQRMKTFMHSNDTDKFMHDIAATNAEHCWVAAAEYFIPYVMWYGMTYYTTDGGSTWTERGNYGVSLTSLHFADPLHGWTAGDASIFFVNEIVQFPLLQFEDPDQWFTCIHFSDTLNGWAAGKSGTIMHTLTGGLVGVSSDENNDNLSIKIFPNPSSGLLYLKHEDIGDWNAVTVNLYDLSGREQDILVEDNYNEDLARIRVKQPVPGIYFLKTNYGNGFNTSKLLIY